jgi:hypothetical protein
MMRIEGPSYLPATAAPRYRDVTPVQQIVLAREEAREARAAKPSTRLPDESFEDALMQVSVPDLPLGHVAMLYEVQRLAQGPMHSPAGGMPFHAAIAYDMSLARRQIEAQTIALPATRV